MLDMMLAFSVVLLLLDSYFYCYATFQQCGWVSTITDRLLMNIQKTGAFDHRLTLKGFSLLLLVLSLIGGFGRKSLRATYASCCWLIGMGCVLYFGSCLLAGAGWYMLISTAGYVLVLVGIARLMRVLPSPFRKRDPFGELQAGFPQARQRIPSAFGVNLPATYTYLKKEKKSWNR